MCASVPINAFSLLAVFSNKYTNLRTSHAFYHVLSRSRDNPDFVSGFIFKAKLTIGGGGKTLRVERRFIKL